ncbi:cytochrome c [Aquitalea sp. LB_tupeE]|uniref:c-type cytochrome n=1 Tax=Aquitalea sp. LB_tupeE TaxID=2748078 RepID=UPI0015C19DC0|nr:cytochrome c [Aquitalea sp. LB_tupeE]NWK78822.1 cytochrome c [Aquitalea sp. LB_tupeE]
MKYIISIVLLSISCYASADNSLSKGQSIATTLCVACHGTGGVSTMENYPNLASQKSTYIVKQLKDFREGRRQDPIMNNMAASLDDVTIKSIAEYYSGQTSK